MSDAEQREDLAVGAGYYGCCDGYAVRHGYDQLGRVINGFLA